MSFVQAGSFPWKTIVTKTQRHGIHHPQSFRDQINLGRRACYRRSMATVGQSQIDSGYRKLESAVIYSKLAEPPPKIINSRGCYLFTSEGREILDSTSGAAVAALGHNNSRVKEAVMRQLNKVSYCWAPFFTTEPAEVLAKKLSDSTQGALSKAFIVSSGIFVWKQSTHRKKLTLIQVPKLLKLQ